MLRKWLAIQAPKDKGGRPKKRQSGPGRSLKKTVPAADPATAAPRVGTPAALLASPQLLQRPKKKAQTYHCWTSGKGLEIVRSLVREWLDLPGPRTTRIKVEGMSQRRFMKAAKAKFGIPRSSLYPYLLNDREKRRPIGGDERGGQGHKQILSKEQRQLVIETIQLRDRQNQGMSRRDAIALIQDVAPGATKAQAQNTWAHTVKPGAQKNNQLTGTVTAQKTTSKRSNINIPQQLRFHNLVEGCDKRHIEQNLDDDSGVDFASVQKFFKVNLDEQNFMASDGKVRIIGDKGIKKHETELSDSRVSCTALFVGSAGDTKGPVQLLLAGRERKLGYNDACLRLLGCPEGSHITMTPTAFMTDDAWEEITPFLIKGIRAMPVIRDHPLWWVRLSLDGFKSHVNSASSMKLFQEAKIDILKEEADSSQVNQPFDRDPALDEKRIGRDLMSCLRLAVRVLDQWKLVHIIAEAHRVLPKGSWERSFKRCNLHPDHRVGFVDWCERIMPELQCGSKFEIEDTDTDRRALLPPWWRNLAQTTKEQAAAIASKYHYDWGCQELLQELMGEPVSFSKSQLHQVPLCVRVEEMYGIGTSVHTNAEVVESSGTAPVAAAAVAAAAVAAEAPLADISILGRTHGLQMYQLVPQKLKQEITDLKADLADAKAETVAADALLKEAAVEEEGEGEEGTGGSKNVLQWKRALKRAKAESTSIQERLTKTQLKLFDHMCKYKNRMATNNQRKPSYLKYALNMIAKDSPIDYEIRPEQVEIIAPSDHDLHVGMVMREQLDHSGRNGKRRVASRRLNVMGQVNAYCEHANSAEKIHALESQLRLKQGLVRIEELERSAAKKKKSDVDALLRTKLAGGLQKLARGDTVKQLTVLEIQAVAYFEFQKKLKGKKAAIVAKFNEIAVVGAGASEYYSRALAAALARSKVVAAPVPKKRKAARTANKDLAKKQKRGPIHITADSGSKSGSGDESESGDDISLSDLVAIAQQRGAAGSGGVGEEAWEFEVWFGDPYYDWFKGRVIEKEEEPGVRSRVLFEDGDEQWLDLAVEKTRFIGVD